MSKKREIGTGKSQDILEKQAKHKSIYLSLGSNLSSSYGNRIDNLEIAQLLLLINNIFITKKSNYYETLSYPNKSHPKFINCVIKVKSSYSPIKFLQIISSIEKFLGRKKTKKNYPRVCDIDIIDYKGKILNFKNKKKKIIKIPHINLHTRNFVLIPLLEISPKWIHPVFKKNIKFFLSKLNNYGKNYINKV